ncbi:hypothetical protein Q8F55_004676 [Vanrija albida]|uniref:Uncharacterized protein n=1 Tax=Vanrija albida TaxID=181172 RepID=A0ABR3Q825_9TREE
MVAAMKRGRLARRPSAWARYRLWILGALAAALVVYLNAVWLARISARVGARGGWRALLPTASLHDEV